MFRRLPLDESRAGRDLGDLGWSSDERRRFRRRESILVRPATLTGVVVDGRNAEHVRGRVDELGRLERALRAVIHTSELKCCWRSRRPSYGCCRFFVVLVVVDDLGVRVAVDC